MVGTMICPTLDPMHYKQHCEHLYLISYELNVRNPQMADIHVI